MQGAGGEHRGIIPRAAEQVFGHAAELALLGWEFSFEASFLEIYNEEIRDLLPDKYADKVEGGEDAAKKLRIIDNGDSVQVHGLRSATVSGSEQLADLMAVAAKSRATASTKCNDMSSRSHYLFRLKLCGKNETTGASSEGELNLVDLAGSERVKESGVQGKAMTEAQNINKSLSALGDVISSMSTKAKHVPYRNSKLTHMLANALSGSSKTLMFVNVSPLVSHHSESTSALKFAAKAGGVDVGPAERKVKKDA
jgi:kinesin family protein C1